MFLEILLSMLGNWARSLILWLSSHPLYLLLVYGAWLLMLGAGKVQLRRNIQFLENSTMSFAQQAINNEGKVNVARVYDLVYCAWKQQIHRLAWFIPHRWELWPIPARLEVVQQRIGFSPEWVEKVLQKNHILTKE
jgi:hypothetical protein